MMSMKLLRESKGLSQMDIALKTGLAPATISRIENGHHRPSRATRQAIAQALSVSPESIQWQSAVKSKEAKR